MDAKAEKAVEQIAKQVLGIETLEAQKLDRLDFHDVAVWNVKEALEAAYRAGLEAGSTK